MSSRSPSPRHSYPERRKSISLSPIRTESGANLRTANWTKMRFRAPGESKGAFQASNYNWNQRNYHHHNYNYRGNFNPRGRWQNRGRGNYRGNWNRGGGYIPKRRNYSRNYDSRSRSRSRSYSRSRSRSRSYSTERRRSFSRSRSRSYSRSRSRSRSPPRQPAQKSPPKSQEKPAAKSEALSYFRDDDVISKKTLEPGKVGVSKWDSPEKKYGDDVQVTQKSTFPFGQSSEKSSAKPQMEFRSFPTYEQSGGANGQGEEGHSAAQVQQMMEKTALASVARHEKSLMKIRKAQGKMKKMSKSDSSDDNLDENEILQMMKSVKKAKKKKNKNKLGKKMTKAKLKKMKLAAASSSSDSDDKSSENSSDMSSPEIKKKAMALSRKKKKLKAGSMSPQSKKMRHNEEANLLGSYGGEIRKDMPMQSGVPLMPQTIAQAPGNQPVMLMAPNLLGANGQPMNVIQLAVPGPDGKMQVLQIPSMTQEGQQPIVMLPPTAMQQPQQAVGQSPVISFPTSMATSAAPTPPAPVPKPVPPPAPPGEPPMSSQAAAPQKQYEDMELGDNHADKELSEKQKRRKEVIRTRLWPRPAKTTWDEEEENAKQETDGAANDRQSELWGKSKQSKADDNVSYDYGNGPKDSHGRGQDKNSGNSILGYSSDIKTEGQKIPSLARGSLPAPSVDGPKGIDELPRKKTDNPVPVAPTGLPKGSISGAYHQPQLVAYPSHITQSSYEPVYVGSQGSAESGKTAQGDFNQGKESKWNTATEEFIQNRQNQKKGKYDEEPAASSSDEDFTTALMSKKSKKKNYEEQMMEMQEEIAYQEDESKKMKKKKKNKKERKDSFGTEEATSPIIKEKKRKKKKKNKDKDYENVSDSEMKKLRKEKKHDKSEMDEDDLVRHIPSDLPLSHIRGLVVRQDDEGNQSIFEHVDFSKLASESEFAEEKDSYEDQFVSLFGSTSEESKPAKKISPLNMSKKALKKIKIAPEGPRTVAHMTEVSLSERIAAIWEANQASEKKKNVSQKVSVNLASLSHVDNKYEKLNSPSRSRSSSPDDRRRRSRSSSYGSESSRSRSKSRSPRSLPKAYSGDRSFDRQDRGSRSRSRSRDGDRRGYRNNNRGYFQPYNRYNQRFQYRGRGNFVNYRARGRFFHRGFNNNRGYYNNYNNYNNYRGRGNYYNNQRDQNQWRNRRQSYRSDDEERRDRRRSRSYSVSDRRSVSSASSAEDRRDRRNDDEQPKNAPESQEPQQTYAGGDAAQGGDGAESVKVRRKSPDQWTHDMFEQHEKEE